VLVVFAWPASLIFFYIYFFIEIESYDFSYKQREKKKKKREEKYLNWVVLEKGRLIMLK
jgi:hypothetical protein